MKELKEYINNENHLNDVGTSFLERLAKEYGVSQKELWIDICEKNKVDRIIHITDYKDFKKLLTKYKKDTPLNRMNDYVEILRQTIGEEQYMQSYGVFDSMTPRKRKAKKVWNNKTKKYEWRKENEMS